MVFKHFCSPANAEFNDVGDDPIEGNGHGYD